MIIDPQLRYVTLVLMIFVSISCMGLTVGDGNFKCIERERQALLSFTHGLLDPNGMLSSWRNTNAEDFCNWKGVKCSNLTNHITELDLHGQRLYEFGDNYLSGNIDLSVLSALSHLHYLDLSNNAFEGPIPNSMGSFVNLVHLNLSYNHFWGIIPPHLGNLSSLHTLDLQSLGDVKSSKGLEWLSHFFALRHLDLSDMGGLENASDWMQTIYKLPHLETLSLSDCGLPPPIFPSNYTYINISSSLSELDLSSNHLTSSIFSWLSNFGTTLVYLDLSINYLQGYIPDTFGNMTSLSYINFDLNQLEGASPKSSWNFCDLHSLVFSNNDLKGTFLDFIQILSKYARNSLQYLNFNFNNLHGQLPDLSNIFPNLKVFKFDSNKFSGNIPIGLGQLSNLETLSIGDNSLEGTIFEAHFLKLRKLKILDFGGNFLSFQPHSDWVPPFQLDNLYLSSCKLGPKFPHWLQGQSLSRLDISNASISDTIPQWFWNYSFPNWEYLDFSDNKIRGQLPNLSMASHRIRWSGSIYLSSNEFEGQIPLLFFQAQVLDASKNKFSGLPFLCEMNTSSPLYLLDVSDNQFLEELPNCWENLSNLIYLSLARNVFIGGIPSSIGNLSKLNVLHLDDNSFSGEFPSCLKNFSDLAVLDLGGNNLKGEIPVWFGNELSKLIQLSLRSNQFYGNLPSTLCHLRRIQFLDLSLNKFTGLIPDCLHNLDFFINGSLSSWGGLDSGFIMIWKGQNRTIMQTTMHYLKSIDFSGNRLTGPIPNTITVLVSLVALNLSRNNLSGGIPEKIGQLKSLDFLDLSRNELVGQIPATISQISGLSILDLSYNKLCGKIPTGTQLQSFNASAYEGNLELCGSPLPKCIGEGMDSNSIDKKDEVHENEFVTRGFYISMAVGFVVGFWGIFGTLMYCILWRHAYFRLLSDLNDWFYVEGTLFKNKVCKLFRG